MSIRKAILLIVSLIILIITIPAKARSVYVIADTGADQNDIPIIQAYRIQDSNLVYQADYNCVHPLAIGLAIDTDSEFLFVTHEEYQQYPGNVIELVNAKTMKYVDTVTATGATNLAGIVVDPGKQKVYVVDRGTKYLYVYNWYPNIPELVQDGNRIELEGLVNQDIGGAWGIALDEQEWRLWVTSNTQTVRYYDTNDWTHDPNTDYITLSRSAVGIALDLANGHVYTGGSQLNPSNISLIQYDLSADPNIAETTVDVGAPVLGIAVNQQTSLIYLTTYGDSGETTYDNPPKDRLMIYDSNLTKLQWESGDIGNPAGVAVEGNVSYKPPLLTLSKIDDVNDGNCVSPGDEITYTIIYGPNGVDHNNVVITDYLPCEVDYENIFDPNYDYEKHTYTWQIGPLDANDPDDSVMLTVKVNQLAEPLGTIHNYCEIESDLYCTTASEDTNVCCWSPDIIYVNANAVGSDTGLSWYNADPNLRSALQKACDWDCNEIWVAAATYKPTETELNYDAAFDLPSGTAVYGGFAGMEYSQDQRNWITNETILDGDLQQYGTRYVVTANDVNQTAVIDGFIIKNGWKAGIYCKNSLLNVTHNKITDNGFGLYCTNNSQVTIENCEILNNVGRSNYDGSGIYADDSTNLNVANCIISKNASSNDGGGICCKDCNNLTVTNCTITDNEAGNYGGGVYDYNSSSSAITNCTFSGNSAGYGGAVFNNSSDPNITNCIFTGNTADYAYGGGMYNYNESMPTIVNCIFTGNASTSWDGGGMYNHQSSPTLINCTFSKNSAGRYGGGICNWNYSAPNVTNCIFWDNEADIEGSEIYDANSDPNFSYCDIEGGYSGTGNIDADPCFVDPNDPNDYHLGSNSPCIDAGTNTPIGGLPTTDIDGEDRKIDGNGDGNSVVDMGADEYDYRDADFNNDGIVNFIDYAMFANTWQTDSNDPNYNDNFDLEDNNSIDYADLKTFAENWLWIAGWAQTEGAMMGQGMSQGFGLMEGLYLSAPAKQQPTKIKPLDIEYIIKWLEEIWLDEEVRKVITEDEWLKFMESLKEGW